MKLEVLALALASVLPAVVAPAEARPAFDHNGALTWSDRDDDTTYGKRGSRAYRSPHGYTGGLGPRPRAWCGWWMRGQRGGGPELNVAWNWSKWGRPAT